MSDLVHIYYRDDATGFVASYAGQRATVDTHPMPRDEAQALIRITPNGAQMELRPAIEARP